MYALGDRGKIRERRGSYTGMSGVVAGSRTVLPVSGSQDSAGGSSGSGPQ
jgi:hypothetical protein